MVFNFGLGGGSNKQSYESQRDPWAPAAPHLKYTLQEARDIYESQLGRRYFPGQSVVPLAPQYLRGLQTIENRAITGDPNVNEASQQLLQLQRKNPFKNLQEFQNPHQSQIIDDITNRVEAGVNRQFGRAGRGGSLAHQQTLTRDIGDAVQRANFEGYNQAGQLADQYTRSVLAAAEPAFGFGRQNFLRGQQMLGVGEAYQQQEAREIADRMARYNFAQQSPQQRLRQLYELAANAGQLGGKTTGTQRGRNSNWNFGVDTSGVANTLVGGWVDGKFSGGAGDEVTEDPLG